MKKEKRKIGTKQVQVLIITWPAACNTVALISILKKILGARNSPFRFIIHLIRGCRAVRPLVHRGGKLFYPEPCLVSDQIAPTAI